ncbi:MAG: elongation factor P [Chloroflexi bacterium]|nr:elongation factor P [Chloroflexota bacterium]
MISTSDLKRGVMIDLDGQLVQVLSYEHQKIGRGSAQVRMRVKNIRNGAIFETTAQAGSKWPRIRLEQRQVQYLYSEEDLHYFMDKDTYEQFPLNVSHLGEGIHYLKDGMEMELLEYEGEPVGVELPITVVLEVTRTDPGFKGDTASGGTKPATLETGLTINVPLFVNQGDRVKVDTRDATYIERV